MLKPLARNRVIYVDVNWKAIRNAGATAYATIQEAYDAAQALSPSASAPVVIEVGVGVAADFGGLANETLSAYIAIKGQGRYQSVLGAFTNVAGSLFADDVQISSMSLSGGLAIQSSNLRLGAVTRVNYATGPYTFSARGVEFSANISLYSGLSGADGCSVMFYECWSNGITVDLRGTTGGQGSNGGSATLHGCEFTGCLINVSGGQSTSDYTAGGSGGNVVSNGSTFNSMNLSGGAGSGTGGITGPAGTLFGFAVVNNVPYIGQGPYFKMWSVNDNDFVWLSPEHANTGDGTIRA